LVSDSYDAWILTQTKHINRESDAEKSLMQVRFKDRFSAPLGLSHLERLCGWVQGRQEMAARYGVNVHYIPVHLHLFHPERFANGPGLSPVAEEACQRIISVPIFTLMTDGQVDWVVGL